MKRFASHFLLVEGVGFLKNQVVEINGCVIRTYPLTEEMEDVEWHPGVMFLCSDFIHQKMSLYVEYPYDFNTMQPVDETQRTQLL